MPRIVLRDSSGHEIRSEFYGTSVGLHGPGIADDGVLTDEERREAVARLMSRITASRVAGPFRLNFPEEFARRSYVGLQPRTAGAEEAPEFIEADQAYDLSGLTIEFTEEVTRSRGYIDVPAPGEDVIAREDVSLHWANGTVSLEEGAVTMVRPELPERTLSGDWASAREAVASFFDGANDTFSTAIASITGWLA